MTGDTRRALGLELGSDAEARWLLEEVDRRHPGASEEHRHFALRALVERRLAGVPLQYVLGHWAFRQLDLVVDHRVLIPRPETEQVVEVAFGVLGSAVGSRSDPLVVDLGTGSGAIALALATEGRGRWPGIEVWATDVDADALEVAALNLARARGGSPPGPTGPAVTLSRGGWWHALPGALRGRVDLAVSNPPYVAEHEWPELDPEVRLEPYGALVAGRGSVTGVPGMAAVEEIVAGAPAWLADRGMLVVEIAPHQAAAALDAARRAPLGDPRIERDLAGRDRVLVAGGP
ncbi:MAG TPA: HemK/PrmC family methyltransferase [Acidimicrobiales bacterium]